MPESLSRTLLAAELLLVVLPTSLFVVPFVVPAAIMLTPVALLGLSTTVLQGGPRLGQDLWTGAGLLLMALLALCAIAALVCLVGLCGRFVVLGRAGLTGQSRMARLGILLALPPLLLSSLPRLLEEVAAPAFDAERLLVALLYGGVPLLVPAAHLLAELRVRPAPDRPAATGPAAPGS